MDHRISIQLPISMNFMDLQIMFAKFSSFVFADFHNGLLEGWVLSAARVCSVKCLECGFWAICAKFHNN